MPFQCHPLTTLGQITDMNGVVLPQGMADSRAFCEQYLAILLAPMLSWRHSLLYLYMDVLIIGHRDPHELQEFLRIISQTLTQGGFVVVPEKIQQVPLLKY